MPATGIPQVRKVTRRQIVAAIMVSVVILLFTYVVGNTSIPLPDEMGVLQGWDKMKSLSGLNADSIPDEVLLVNVSYDKQLVDYEQEGMPVGQYAITDRRKLLEFLQKAEKAGTYRYIFLDVIFERGIRSTADSALFHQIARMRRIVIPVHMDTPLEDSILYAKAANADYTVTWKETNFARFKYLWDDQPTVPLRMFQEMDGGDIARHGPIYTSNHWLCQNGLTLQLPIRLTAHLQTEQSRMRFNVLQLGADLLAMDSIAPIANEIRDKIVVLGDFCNDVHDTYAGPQPGSIICLNAYYALQRGDHVLWGNGGRRLLFYLLTAIVYFLMALGYITGFSPASVTERPWLKAIISFGSIGLLFWLLAVCGYMLFDTVYNLWIPITAFTVLSTTLYIYSLIKQLKHEKDNHHTTPADHDTDSDTGRKIQDSLPEQSADNH